MLFVVLCVIQVFVLNHCQLFGCAMPLFYIYFVLTLRKGMSKWLMMVISFALGLLLDTFSNTPGVAAASMTFAAMLQPYLLDLFMTRESEEQLVPSMSTIGTKPFVNYTLVMTLVYCLIFFTLEMLNFFHLLKWLECVVGSTILTSALILAADSLKKGKK